MQATLPFNGKCSHQLKRACPLPVGYAAGFVLAVEVGQVATVRHAAEVVREADFVRAAGFVRLAEVGRAAGFVHVDNPRAHESTVDSCAQQRSG